MNDTFAIKLEENPSLIVLESHYYNIINNAKNDWSWHIVAKGNNATD
jgi:hypothetical protein